jgi:hypothetical protein
MARFWEPITQVDCWPETAGLARNSTENGVLGLSVGE